MLINASSYAAWWDVLTAVGVIRETGGCLAGWQLELIEHQEGIQVTKRAGTQRSADAHACSLHHMLALDNLEV